MKRTAILCGIVALAVVFGMSTTAQAQFNLDHFKCYKARRTRLRVDGIATEDQFGPGLLDLKKPVNLCLATDKNGEGLVNQSAALMCYKVKRRRDSPPLRGESEPPAP